MNLPQFSLAASDGRTYSHKDLGQGLVVLYVYPRDMTPGCTIEAHDFQEAMPQFEAAGARVFGLSKDSVASHEKFCAKEGLAFPLLSDPELTLLKPLDAYGEKTMYGKKILGIIRSTFLINNGEIVRAWKNVKVAGHVAEVLRAVQV